LAKVSWLRVFGYGAFPTEIRQWLFAVTSPLTVAGAAPEYLVSRAPASFRSIDDRLSRSLWTGQR
jgi:hypothetical protein